MAIILIDTTTTTAINTLVTGITMVRDNIPIEIEVVTTEVITTTKAEEMIMFTAMIEIAATTEGIIEGMVEARIEVSRKQGPLIKTEAMAITNPR